MLTRSYGHRKVHIDTNNGTRARLQVCNPNPNRVKEKEKGPGVADVTGTRSPPPPRGGKKSTVVLTGAQQEKIRVWIREKKGEKGSQEP